MQIERSDFQTALICTILANANRDPEKRKTPFKIEDFMPRKQKQKAKKKQTPEEMLAMVKVLNAAFGGTVEGE